MRTGFGPDNELHPLLNHLLAGAIRRMGFAGNDELDRTLWIGEQSQQPLRIVQKQVRAFVSGKAPGKTNRQGVGIK